MANDVYLMFIADFLLFFDAGKACMGLYFFVRKVAVGSFGGFDYRKPLIKMSIC